MDVAFVVEEHLDGVRFEEGEGYMPQFKVLAHVLEHFRLNTGRGTLNSDYSFQHSPCKLEFHVGVEVAALLNQIQEHFVECLA